MAAGEEGQEIKRQEEGEEGQGQRQEEGAPRSYVFYHICIPSVMYISSELSVRFMLGEKVQGG
jgi:hypothetical protein